MCSQGKEGRALYILRIIETTGVNSAPRRYTGVGAWGAGCMGAGFWGADSLLAPLRVSLPVVASPAARPKFLRACWRYSCPSARRISLAASGSCDLTLCLLPPAGVGPKASRGGPAVAGTDMLLTLLRLLCKISTSLLFPESSFRPFSFKFPSRPQSLESDKQTTTPRL
jgi:hypothetical protein